MEAKFLPTSVNCVLSRSIMEVDQLQDDRFNLLAVIADHNAGIAHFQPPEAHDRHRATELLNQEREFSTEPPALLLQGFDLIFYRAKLLTERVDLLFVVHGDTLSMNAGRHAHRPAKRAALERGGVFVARCVG